jgi:predicted ATPase/class 3 adenylate cyclase
MAELPAGTVTFLFTDIEGSTSLWERHPEAMEPALARHNAILRAAIRAHGGHIFATAGDSACAAFATAPAALAAALAAQLALRSEPWPDAAPLRVRMALHSSVAEPRDGEYVGPTLNRVARLLGVAHGGQTLLTAAVQELVHDRLPPDGSLADLGEHYLRDLERPERVFQLCHPSLPSEFPPLRSQGAPPPGLPRQLTSFVGREEEIAEMERLLATTRLLTLTGVGGIGKTRLALRIAERLADTFRDGVWLVELAPLSDPALVPHAVATTLGVREQPGSPLQVTLGDVLRPRRSLLVLDNCEHLVAACAALADELLRACPALTILATSREPLGTAGETVWRAPPLAAPDGAHQELVHPSTQALAEYAAVRLFVVRAAAALPSFALTEENSPSVVQICQRLDGIPLAIELAAARIRGLTPEQIAARLDDRFRLLTGGGRMTTPRQQTLQGAIDWSYDLLSEPERALFRCLAVFAGGWTLEAAESVVGGDWPVAGDSPASGHSPLGADHSVLDLLLALVDKSLVLAESAGVATRYRLLETLRQYAEEKLRQAGEEAALRERHLRWFLQLAEEAEPHYHGARAGEWAARMEIEHDNLRAALAWTQIRTGALSVASPPGWVDQSLADAGPRLVAALWWFWWLHSHLGEGLRWIEEALSTTLDSGTATSIRARASALAGAGILAALQRRYPEATAFFEASLGLPLTGRDRWPHVMALGTLGFVAEQRGDYRQATMLSQQAVDLSRELGVNWLTGWHLGQFGRVMAARGDFGEATELLEESLALLQEAEDWQGAIYSVQYLARIAERQGNSPRTVELLEQSLELSQKLDDKVGAAWSLGSLGHSLRAQGNYPRAVELLEQSLALFRDVGDRWGIAWSLGNLGRVAHARGDYGRAAALFEESLAHCRDLTDRQQGIAYALYYLGVVARDLRQAERAARLLGAAESIRDTIGASVSPADRAEHERHTNTLRSTLGEERFAALRSAGRAMSLEQAIEYALPAERLAPTLAVEPGPPVPEIRMPDT